MTCKFSRACLACADDRGACLAEQSNLSLLAGLAMSVACSGMLADQTGKYGLCAYPWLQTVESAFWATATMSLLLSCMSSVLIYMGVSETNTESEFHHFEDLLGAARRLPFLMFAIGTVALTLAIISNHMMNFDLDWMKILWSGFGLGAGLFTIPFVGKLALQVNWALKVVHTTAPLLQRKKEASELTAKDIYNALHQYSDRKLGRFAALNREEFLDQFQGRLGPTMFQLAGKIWDHWLEAQENAILVDLGLLVADSNHVDEAAMCGNSNDVQISDEMVADEIASQVDGTNGISYGVSRRSARV